MNGCSLLLSGEGKQEPAEKVIWDWIIDLLDFPLFSTNWR
jgi:hypothetical protein